MCQTGIIFLAKSFLGNFYRHLAIFSGHIGYLVCTWPSIHGMNVCLIQYLCNFQGSAHSEMFTNFIPPVRFNIITIIVVVSTLIMGILLPDIEFVLGIVSDPWTTIIYIFILQMDPCSLSDVWFQALNELLFD